MKIFISWSKNSSRLIAEELKKLIEEVSNEETVAFFSQKDISAGKEFEKEITTAIEQCDTLFAIITPDSKKAPWLLYEAGYAKGNGKRVVPILFYEDEKWTSWVDNPLNTSQHISINRTDFANKLLEVINVQFNELNKKIIKRFIQRARKIIQNQSDTPSRCQDIVNTLLNNIPYENPTVHNGIVHFKNGFETAEIHKIYADTLTSGTCKRLWIYARRGERLIIAKGKNIIDFLSRAAFSKCGIDFRMLIISPDHPNIGKARAGDAEEFKTRLIYNIKEINRLIGLNEEIRSCFRLYTCERNTAMVVIDNAIIANKVVYDINGYPQSFTDSPFDVVDADSDEGKIYIDEFEKAWQDSEPIKL